MTKNTVPIQIGGRNTSALVDSGASVSIINRDFLGKTSYANDELLPPEFNSVKGASGRLLPVIGKLNADIFIKGQSSCCRWFTSCIHFRSRCFMCL